MAGAAPLSFTEIQNWAKLMDIGDLHPMEVESLLLLDAALANDAEPIEDDPVILPRAPQWPKRKES